jgi:hypothetical protein
MVRAIARSLLIGVAAALVCFALGLVAEGLVASRVRHPAEKPAVATAQPQPQPPPSSDDFKVTTSEVIVSEDSWSDPYLIPSSIGVLIVVSAWTYRRLRKAPNT